MTAAIEAKGVSSGYHGHPVIRDLDLAVAPGNVTALLGANGAGKTTTLLTLAGVIRPLLGEVWIDGRPTSSPLHRRAKSGLAFIREERSVFMNLTVAENLRVARAEPRRVMEIFPELERLSEQRCALLSGGEQQMLAVGQALARRPRLLLADELSFGLAPQVVSRLLDVIQRAAHQDGVAVLLVEQHVRQALHIADEVCVLSRGNVVLRGRPADVAEEIESAYLAGDAVDRVATDSPDADEG